MAPSSPGIVVPVIDEFTNFNLNERKNYEARSQIPKPTPLSEILQTKLEIQTSRPTEASELSSESRWSNQKGCMNSGTIGRQFAQQADPFLLL